MYEYDINVNIFYLIFSIVSSLHNDLRIFKFWFKGSVREKWKGV